MRQEFEKMSIKGQKSAIILCRTLLNNPQQFDYIKDTYLVKRHGSWQFKDKLSVMLDKGDGNMTRHERQYLLKEDKKISNNNKKYIWNAVILVTTVIICGILTGNFILRLKGVI